MVDICHYTFVKTHTMYNTKRGSHSKLWTSGDNDVSVQGRQFVPLCGMWIMGEAIHVWEQGYNMRNFCSLYYVAVNLKQL